MVIAAGFGFSRGHGTGRCGIGGGVVAGDNPHHGNGCGTGEDGDKDDHAAKNCPLEEMYEEVEAALDSLSIARVALSDVDTEASSAVERAYERLSAFREKIARRCPMKEDAGRPVNVKCPMMGSELNPDEVNEDLKHTFRGETVGFCCLPCLDAWDDLSGEEKAEELERTP